VLQFSVPVAFDGVEFAVRGEAAIGRADRSSRVLIVPATLRDLTYVAAHMCDEDRAEVACQLDDASALAVATASFRDFAFCVELDGNPEAALGCGCVRSGYWVAWSWGTRRAWRCWPEMIGFIRGWLQPSVYDMGAYRVEARALLSHERAHRFLERIGGQRRCELRAFGRGGEDFVLYDWTRETWNGG
jgi:hypothetical protein